MPCDSIRRKGLTAEARQAQIKKALARLEALLRTKGVRVTIGPQGAVAFDGWTAVDRDDVTDVCAYRMLSAAGSWALRQAVAAAEAATGRTVNVQAIAAGVHRHGDTWHKGH